MNPQPLPTGSTLADRFEIESVIGSGGFSVVYLAEDHDRGDRVVVKELAPKDAKRSAHGVLDLGEDGHRLRRKFLDEGALQAKLKISGLVGIRCWFAENGTAYVVSEHLPDAKPLSLMLQEKGALDADTALIIFYRLLDIVEAIHVKRILHRDIKPSNVLVADQEQVWLIDFGAAREWRMDAQTQTVVFTPNFSPPEQLSERARRGPATDIYALSATLYMMLLGQLPPSVAERAAGNEPDFERITALAGGALSQGLEKGLALKMLDRPQTIEEFREVLESGTDAVKHQSLEELDEAVVRLHQLSFGNHECPACGGVLVSPKPLRPNGCPVCTEGLLTHREIFDKLCPVCKTGVLHRHENLDPPFTCPWCGLGRLHYHRAGLLSKNKKAHCERCGLTAEWKPGTFEIVTTGKEAQTKRTRAEIVWQCDACEAQFDERSDSRLEQIDPPPKRFTALYPEEWARVASGLEPGAGNVECGNCGAEFFKDGQTITLLGVDHDPNGFAEAFTGRRLNIEDIRWLGAGKMSPHKGYICEDCGTEFDFAGNELLLVHTDNRALGPHAEEVHDLEDWHRLGQKLALRGHEHYEAEIREALRDAYLNGQIGFDGRFDLAWKGSARRTGSSQDGALSIDSEEISFGGLLRKWKKPRADILRSSVEHDSTLTLVFRGDEEQVEFEIAPTELMAHLKSGAYSTPLSAVDLDVRLKQSTA